MNLFKKCRKKNFKKREFKKCKYKIVGKSEKINVGKTHLKLTFSDGSEFYTFVIGSVNQEIYYGRNECEEAPLEEPQVYDFTIQNSLKVAQKTLTNYFNSEVFFDNPLEPKICVRGKVVKVEIMQSEDFETESLIRSLTLKENGEVK